jgi:hypothetical protein
MESFLFNLTDSTGLKSLPVAVMMELILFWFGRTVAPRLANLVDPATKLLPIGCMVWSLYPLDACFLWIAL